MKIYGSGQLKYPGTSRIVWDFEDGPFDTVNETLIMEAKRRGFAFTPPPVIEVKPRKGRPPKADSEKKGKK